MIMAINPFLMLSGIGMMVVAVAAMLYWRVKTGTKWKFFLAGAGVWLVAIFVKALMDLTITMPLQQWMFAAGGIAGALLGIGLYAGLRTGLLESGLSYITVLKTTLKKMKYKDAMAFGIGFGVFEALVIGFSTFLNVFIFVLMPEIIATLPMDIQAIILEQLSVSTLFIIPAIIERAAAILIHAFAGILVVYAVRSRKLKYLWYSVIYKTVVDGIIPVLVVTLQPGTLTGAYLIEIPFILLGLVGYFGILWMSKKRW